MGGNLAAVIQTHIGQKALVTLNQRGAHEGIGESHYPTIGSGAVTLNRLG